MKNIKIIMLLICFFSIAGIYNCNAKPKFVFGSHSRPDATGEGCDGDHGICIIIHLRLVNDDFDIKDLGDDMALGEMEIVDGELKMNILFDNSKNCFDKTFSVIRKVTLDEDVAELLGYRHVEINAGEYGVDFSRFRFGSVVIPVEVR